MNKGASVSLHLHPHKDNHIIIFHSKDINNFYPFQSWRFIKASTYRLKIENQASILMPHCCPGMWLLHPYTLLQVLQIEKNSYTQKKVWVLGQVTPSPLKKPPPSPVYRHRLHLQAHTHIRSAFKGSLIVRKSKVV